LRSTGRGRRTRPGSAFLKLGARRYLVISIAMAAATLEIDDGVACARGRGRRLLGGGAAPAGARSGAAGAPLDRAGRRGRAAHLAPLSPIDDVRGSAAYRRDAVVTCCAACSGLRA
jgi:CO/xanthine dehydrogenase FAD-binding subunit